MCILCTFHCVTSPITRYHLVPAVHSWTVWLHRRMQFHMLHVCWRHTGLPQHASLWPRRCEGTPGQLHWRWPTVIWSWTRRKLRSSGWAHVSNWTSSAFKLWPFQTPRSSFQLQPKTLALYWTVSWPWLIMLLHSADPVFFYIRQLKSIKQSVTNTRGNEDITVYLHHQSNWLLQQCVHSH